MGATGVYVLPGVREEVNEERKHDVVGLWTQTLLARDELDGWPGLCPYDLTSFGPVEGNREGQRMGWSFTLSHREGDVVLSGLTPARTSRGLLESTFERALCVNIRINCFSKTNMYTHTYKLRSRFRLHAGTYRENCLELKGKLKEVSGHEREQHQNRDGRMNFTRSKRRKE